MKSEERHQLLTNDLGVEIERTVGFFERHLGLLIGLISAALVLGGAIYWFTRTVESESAEGWTLLDTAQNLEEFGTVIDKFKGKPPAQWAQLFVAETNLKTGMPLMFSNREIAKTDVKSAREGFESLLQEKTDPMIRERALWGLALCLETTSDGNTSKVIDAYQRLTTEFPETIFKVVADDRIATLKKDGSKEFYAWFSKENPKPPEARPRDFKNDESGLPGPAQPKEDPDDFLIEKTPGGSKKATEEKSTTPAESTEKPDTSAETPEKPNEPAKPEEGEKPSEKEASEGSEKPSEKN
jgi:hypothetical protein